MTLIDITTEENKTI